MIISSFEMLQKLACERRNSEKRCVVAAGAQDSNVISTLARAASLGMIDVILVGPKTEIMEKASEVSADISGFDIVDASTPQETVLKAVTAVKSLTGAIIMKGTVMTGALMQGILDRENGLRTDRILSHVGVVKVPKKDGFLLITDAGINIAPDLTRKRDIILNAVQVANTLRIECPKVAMLSFIESAEKHSSPSITDAVMLTEMNRQGIIPGCIVEGPYALDNAISQKSVKTKGLGDRKVAGCADIVVAHDIHMGNAIFKSIQLWVDTPIASVVVGCAAPLVVPSRADSPESKLMSIALAVQMMNYAESKKTSSSTL